MIRKEPDKLFLENPGYIRTGKKQMRLGGMSDPRNKALMKMFNLINIGERAGSGVPNIFQVWEAQGWTEPVIIERFNPDRTVLELCFAKKVPEKSAEKKCRKKMPEKSAEKKCQKKITRKTQEHYELILSAMQPEIWYKVSDFADILSVGERRIKLLLSELVELGRLESIGSTKGKRYRLKEK